MKKMDFFGVGPKIGRILVPYWIATIVISIFSELFHFTPERSSTLTIAGATMLVFGLVFYFISGKTLMKGIKEGKLVTNGTFVLCRNPLYISIVLFVIPAVALLMNSWLELTACVVGFVLLKIYVGREYQVLEEAFGDEYRKYKVETPEFFPLPLKKWFRKN